MQIDELLEQFTNWGRYERRYAPATLNAYLRDLRQLLTFAESQGYEPVLEALDEGLLRAFLRELTDQGYESTSVHRKFHAFGAFFTWAVREGYLVKSPLDRIILPPEKRKLPGYMTVGELRLFLTTPVKPYARYRGLALRDEVAFKLLANTDLSIAAALRLKVGDVRINARVIYAGNREIPLPDDLVPLLRTYVDSYRPPESPFLTDYCGRRWSSKYYRRAFWRHIETCGLDYQGRLTSPKALSPEQLAIFLSTPVKPYFDKFALESRDQFAFALMGWLGLRRSEVVGLNVGDVNLDDLSLLVRGKGDSVRLVPLPPELLDLAKKHVHGRGPEEPLLRSWLGKRWRAKDLYKAFKRHAAHCGLDPDRVYPHMLRHSVATHLIRSGVGLPEVKRLLGHERLESTMVYVGVDVDQLRRALDNHPLRRL